MPPIHEKLALTPHPEGGYFREYYRAEQQVRVPAGTRPASTGIYFLLYKDDISRLHRLRHDEYWLWHSGANATVHTIDQEGAYRKHTLGPNGDLAIVLPAGVWFGAEAESPHVLMSAIVAPGFDFEDFELADREELLSLHAEHKDIILRLT